MPNATRPPPSRPPPKRYLPLPLGPTDAEPPDSPLAEFCVQLLAAAFVALPHQQEDTP